MEKLKLLLAVLQLYKTNFQILHWNAYGREFDKVHNNITNDYEALCGNNVDVVAEMITRLGGNPVNYKDVLDLISNRENKDFLLIDSNELYNRDDVVKFSDIMFADILEVIRECLSTPEIAEDLVNVGIKATLESIYNDFDLQYRYLNRRRSMNCAPYEERE